MTQRLKNLLASSLDLRQLSGKLQQLHAIQNQFALIVPASLKQSCQVMNFELGVLTLAANNGTVAAKLRQLAPDLQQQLNFQGCKVTLIQVKVQVTLPPTQVKHTPANLGPNGQKQITQLADTLKDSPLKNALVHLIKSARLKK